MRTFAYLLLPITLIPATAPALSPMSINGKFLTQSNVAMVKVNPCGGSLCATIQGPGPSNEVWPVYDKRNSDPALRNRPLTGLNLIADAKPEGDHWRGKIYSPRDGRSYSATFTPTTDGTLKVHGCWGFICLTQIWHPAK